MPRLFVPASSIHDGLAVIDGDAGRHLARSLRIRPGEQLRIVDDGRVEHGVEVLSAHDGRIEARVDWSRPARGEPERHVTVLQSVSKEGMEDAIDAAVSAGAVGIAPVVTQRTIVRLDPDRADRRQERWQAVAREAAQVAFRGAVPTVHPVRTLGDALAALTSETQLVVCAMTDLARPIAEIALGIHPLALVVGPEGGFAEEDLGLLAVAGAEFAHLGPRVFRSRYAASHALFALMLVAGELADPVAQAPVW